MKKLPFIIFFIVSIIPFSFADKGLQTKADRGDIESQYLMGIVYSSYDVPDYDFEIALKYLRMAKANGHQGAEYRLSELTSRGYDGWGDFRLTPFYDLGILNSTEEARLIDMVSDDDAGASVVLAHSFFKKKDYSNALKYYDLTIKLLDKNKLGSIGDRELEKMHVAMDAITRIAFCYEHGLGINKDWYLALSYYSILGGYIETPHSKICEIMNSIAEKYNSKFVSELTSTCGGQVYDGFVPEPTAMRPWDKIGILYIKLMDYKRGSEALAEYLGLQGNGARTLWIGEMFYKGLGRQQNYDEAFKCFNYIVTQANAAWEEEILNSYPEIYADACYRLYECYTYGRGTAKDYDKARLFFRMALKYGSSSALYDDQKKYEVLQH